MLASHSMPLAFLEIRVPKSSFGKDGLHAIPKLGEPSENSSFQYLPGLLFDCSGLLCPLFKWAWPSWP